MSEWPADLRIALRLLRKTPGFTASAVAVLALGIGLNAAMFAVVYALTLMGPPYAEPDRLVQLYSSRTRQPDSYQAFSHPAYELVAASGGPLQGVLAHSPTIVGIGQGAQSRRAFAVLVSRNYFDLLGVPLATGRGFTEEECAPGGDVPVLVAGWNYWKRTGFDPGLLGASVRINERSFTVVGIAPKGFTGTMTAFGPELFFPLGVFDSLSKDFQGSQPRTLARADAFHLFLVARLRNGADARGAAASLAPIAAGLAGAYPAEYQDARLTLGPLPRFGTSTSPRDEGSLGLLGTGMLILTGAVLLTVCLNLASLLTARGVARRKEFAIRLAIGGGRLRIVRQLLTEGLLLSLAGGALGMALGLFAVDALVTSIASLLPITIALEGAVSPALLAATLLLSLVATAAFALGPALRLTRGEVLRDLKLQAGEALAGRPRGRPARHLLLVSQVALSLALLVAAGLFVRMARTATAVDFGFRADDTVLAEVDSSLAGLGSEQSILLYSRLERRLQSQPGVQSAAVGALVPLGFVSMSRGVKRAGVHVPPDARPQTPEQGRAFRAPWNAVSGPYFATMGLAILRGRTFTALESFEKGAPPVAIVDEALARKLWPDGDALGQHVEWREGDASAATVSREVVGVVASTRSDLFEKTAPGAVFVPFAQGALGNAYLHVRPQRPLASLVDTVRREIRAEAPGLPVFGVRAYRAHIQQSAEYWMLRLSSVLFAVFGAFATLVAMLGVHGVLSQAVAGRTREIGIRMAIGALPAAVARMVLGESLSLTLKGVALGLLLGLGTGRLMSALFVDVAPFDWAIFSSLPLLLVAAGLLAAWLPARRATRVSPLTALRCE
ncbi:MAG: ADOP family duplicated permease [Vicinamibacteria bacterium]